MKFNWKVALIRIPINGLVLVITAWILPDMQIREGIMSFLILGASFGILNAVLRPVIQFFTLPLIFVTGGAIIILINAILLWVLEHFLPERLQFDSLITLLLAALLVGLLVLILESLFGITPPIIDRTLVEANRSSE